MPSEAHWVQPTVNSPSWFACQGGFLACILRSVFLAGISYQCVHSDVVLLPPEVTGLNILSSCGPRVAVIAQVAGLCGAI